MRTNVALVAALGVILVGCGGAAAPSLPPSPLSPMPALAIATATPASPSGTRASPTLRQTPSPMPLAPPPPPTAVRINRQGCYTGPSPDGVPSGECKITVAWKEGATKGTEIRVYGVTECPSAAKLAGGGSCLLDPKTVTKPMRSLIAKARASDGKVSWTRPAWLDVIRNNTIGPSSVEIGVDRDGGDIYFGIMVAAYNSAGHSTYIIADAGTWCYDTGCQGP